MWVGSGGILQAMMSRPRQTDPWAHPPTVGPQHATYAGVARPWHCQIAAAWPPLALWPRAKLAGCLIGTHLIDARRVELALLGQGRDACLGHVGPRLGNGVVVALTCGARRRALRVAST